LGAPSGYPALDICPRHRLDVKAHFFLKILNTRIAFQ
jgi:hypothetical protein